MADDLDPLEQQLVAAVRALGDARGVDGTTPGAAAALAAWAAQRDSRAIDHAARWLQAQRLGFYTIGSAGHESNAYVALALRPTDPALLHYRSGAFYLARAGQVAHDGVWDVLLGMAAAQEEPIAGGRHKVFGHPDLAVIPQTSTIASHLPRAVGIADAIERARRLGLGTRWPDDAVVVCSFGDASLNHATAQSALNWASLAAYRGEALPLLFVCEDNGIGISVRTPDSWVEQSLYARPELLYEQVDGADAPATQAVTAEVAAWVREHRAPAILHLRTVRYLSHAGADVETAYRTAAEIRADYERDPLLATARWLVDAGLRSGDELADDLLAARESMRLGALSATRRPQIPTAEAVLGPLAPRSPEAVAREVERAVPATAESEPLTVAQAVNSALAEALEVHPEALLFGEDVGRKGGVYGVTRGLQERFGAERVLDTHLDETSILGLALGAGVSGLLPIPEIQYLAYLHNAEDQLRGEAATLQFFSQGAYRNGMVVRIQGYGYQKGFGGHFHNDNGVGVLRDVPGLVVASPARPDDAAALLRTCVAAARVDGTVAVVLEPIALYHTRDLHEPDDGLWAAPLPSAHAPVGVARVYGDGADLTIVSWGNGLFLSLRAARTLAARGIQVRVVDIRWLAPLPVADIVRESAATGRVLVVDETRRTGGVGEGIVSELVATGFQGRIARVAGKDSFVPLGDAALLVLVSQAEIEDAALRLVG